MSSQNTNIMSIGRGQFRVTGTLTFSTVPEFYQKSKESLTFDDATYIDLRGVKHADSAGLALLIQWMRDAHMKQQTVHFSNIPLQLLAIAKVCSVEVLLPIVIAS